MRTKMLMGIAAIAACEDTTRDEAAGETVILVGPSGCGKSTLKMINRLEVD